MRKTPEVTTSQADEHQASRDGACARRDQCREHRQESAGNKGDAYPTKASYLFFLLFLYRLERSHNLESKPNLNSLESKDNFLIEIYFPRVKLGLIGRQGLAMCLPKAQLLVLWLRTALHVWACGYSAASNTWRQHLQF